MKSKEEIEQLARKCGTRYNGYFGYINGYTQCQENNKDKKYTEEDLKKAMNYASQITNNKMKYIEDYINSLNKQD